MSKKKTATAQQTDGISMYETFKKNQAQEQESNRDVNEEFMEQLKENGLSRKMLTAIAKLMYLQPWSGKGPDQVTLVGGVVNGKSIGYHFIKLEKAVFGRVKVHSQYWEELAHFDPKKYKHTQNLNQTELYDLIKNKEWFVYDAGEQAASMQEAKPQPRKQEAKAPVETAPFELVYYSDKSAALFGDTKPYKDVLNKEPYRGVFNGSLTHPETNEKVKGWLFTLDPKRIAAVEKKFSIKLRKAKQNIAA